MIQPPVPFFYYSKYIWGTTPSQVIIEFRFNQLPGIIQCSLGLLFLWD